MSYKNIKCKDCMYHARRDGCIYCVLNHYFPRWEMIAFHGCSDYVEEKLDLFNMEEGENTDV